MPSWLVAVILQPFGALLLFFIAAVLCRWINRHLPEGRIKRILSTRIGP